MLYSFCHPLSTLSCGLKTLLSLHIKAFPDPAHRKVVVPDPCHPPTVDRTLPSHVCQHLSPSVFLAPTTGCQSCYVLTFATKPKSSVQGKYCSGSCMLNGVRACACVSRWPRTVLWKAENVPLTFARWIDVKQVENYISKKKM